MYVARRYAKFSVALFGAVVTAAANSQIDLPAWVNTLFAVGVAVGVYSAPYQAKREPAISDE